MRVIKSRKVTWTVAAEFVGKIKNAHATVVKLQGYRSLGTTGVTLIK
jgi:hypothetical protein